MDFLLEIGGEELPASFVISSQESLEIEIKKYLEEQSIPYENIKAWGTPRRLVLYITNLASQSLPKKIAIKGPPKKVAYDKDHKPTKALLGFLQGNNSSLEEVSLRTVSEGEYVFIEKEIPPIQTEKLLSSFLPMLIKDIRLPKAMRWEVEDFYFSRPIRWVVSMFHDKVIPFQLGNLSSGNLTKGHRFFGEEIPLTTSEDYLEKLREQYVLVNQEERKEKIREGLNNLSKEVGGSWEKDEDLLQEVTYLVEYPQVLRGKIPEELLNIPTSLLSAVLKHHLRAFPLFSVEGKPLPYFLFVSNNPAPEAHKNIISGYEQVAVARLRDGHFFYQEDKQTPLDTLVDGLDGVVFMQGLGTLKDKSLRLLSTIENLPGYWNEEEIGKLKRIMKLLKFDQVTQVVKEFPELEGIMAKDYALVQGEPPDIAEALYEVYVPKSSGDSLPQTKLGMWASVLDRLDSLAGLFSLGYKPSGSEDPYGIRRYATGVVRVLQVLNKEVKVEVILEKFFEHLKPKEDRLLLIDEILKLLSSRLEILWLEEGYRYDTVRAILNQNFPLNLSEAQERLKKLAEWYEQEMFIDLVLVIKRIQNILKGQKITTELLNPSLLREPAEENLYHSIIETSRKLEELPLADWLPYFSKLGKTVDKFFDEVLVMTKEEEIKNNRLVLLKNALMTFSRLGDLSQITIRR